MASIGRFNQLSVSKAGLWFDVQNAKRANVFVMSKMHAVFIVPDALHGIYAFQLHIKFLLG